MGTLGGRPGPDDDALRRASEQAAIDMLLKLNPDFAEGLAGKYWRGEIGLDCRPVSEPDSAEPAPGGSGAGSVVGG